MANVYSAIIACKLFLQTRPASVLFNLIEHTVNSTIGQRVIRVCEQKYIFDKCTEIYDVENKIVDNDVKA